MKSQAVRWHTKDASETGAPWPPPLYPEPLLIDERARARRVAPRSAASRALPGGGRALLATLLAGALAAGGAASAGAQEKPKETPAHPSAAPAYQGRPLAEAAAGPRAAGAHHRLHQRAGAAGDDGASPSPRRAIRAACSTRSWRRTGWRSRKGPAAFWWWWRGRARPPPRLRPWTARCWREAAIALAGASVRAIEPGLTARRARTAPSRSTG